MESQQLIVRLRSIETSLVVNLEGFLHYGMMDQQTEALHVALTLKIDT